MALRQRAALSLHGDRPASYDLGFSLTPAARTFGKRVWAPWTACPLSRATVLLLRWSQPPPHLRKWAPLFVFLNHKLTWLWFWFFVCRSRSCSSGVMVVVESSVGAAVVVAPSGVGVAGVHRSSCHCLIRPAVSRPHPIGRSHLIPGYFPAMIYFRTRRFLKMVWRWSCRGMLVPWKLDAPTAWAAAAAAASPTTSQSCCCWWQLWHGLPDLVCAPGACHWSLAPTVVDLRWDGASPRTWYRRWLQSISG
jgi:hypothetical protein